MSAVRRALSVVGVGDKASTFQLERDAIAQAERDSAEKLSAARAAVTASIEALRKAVEADEPTAAAERAHEQASVRLATVETLHGIQRHAFATRRDALEARVLKTRIEKLQAALSPVVRELSAAEDNIVAQMTRLSEALSRRDEALVRVGELEGRLSDLGGAPVEPRNPNRSLSFSLETEAADAFRAAHDLGTNMNPQAGTERVTVLVKRPSPARSLLEEDDSLAGAAS